MNRQKEQQLTKEKKLSQKRLKELLWYNPYTGLFFRQTHKGGAKAGDIAGWIDGNGYRVIRVNGEVYLAHRLAWLYMKGRWPKKQIDHKNGNPSDNRWDNLREATGSENQWNRKINKNNSTGYKGVCFHKASQNFRARIQHNGKNKSLGYYDTPEEAYTVYCEAAKELQGKFSRLK